MSPLHDVGWDLRGPWSEHMHVALLCGLGFLTAWPPRHSWISYLVSQGCRGEHPEKASLRFLWHHCHHIPLVPSKSQAPHIQGRWHRCPHPLMGEMLRLIVVGLMGWGILCWSSLGNTVCTPLPSFPSTPPQPPSSCTDGLGQASPGPFPLPDLWGQVFNRPASELGHTAPLPFSVWLG